MSWWGKVIGGTFGFMLGGPLGALLGASLGHNFDRGMGRLQHDGGFSAGPDVERIQSAFFTTTFSMMGYLAKADGVVTRDEIAMAESVMVQLRLDQAQKKVAISLFNQGKDSGFPAQQVLEQFRHECHGRRNLLQMFLEILIATALADGKLNPVEQRILQQTAYSIGYSGPEFLEILQRQQAGAHMQTQRPDSAAALKDAYKLLGVAGTATDDEVKKAYRRLMNQHHPDKLVARGLPEEMMALAHKKTMEIKEAYELVRKSRAA
ncbi:MAG: co-chaperone DjlA [Pseudohongiellaceae bacterium]